MKCYRVVLFSVFSISIALNSPTSHAAPMLFDFGLNLDGQSSCSNTDLFCSDTVADLSGIAGVDDSAFDYGTGLGRIEVTFGGVGAHFAGLFVDHNIGAPNFDETASAVGAPAAGQTWEIDEPGFGTRQGNPGSIFDQYFGDIVPNFVDGLLDDQAWFDAIDGQTLPSEEGNVSMALGHSFELLAGEIGLLSFIISDVMPAVFHLRHSDAVEDGDVFFSTSLTIRDAAPVTEPGTLALLAIGVGALAWRRKRTNLEIWQRE